MLYFLHMLDGQSAVWSTAWRISEFPFWWFTHGLRFFGTQFGRMLRGVRRSLGVSVWATNLFVPMFGERDIASRIISFFMRLVQLLARSAALLAVGAVSGAVFLAWIALPILAFVFMLAQLAGFAAQ